VSTIALTATIGTIHRNTDEVYGSLRVHAGLVAVHGMAVSPKRVEVRLMDAATTFGGLLHRFFVIPSRDRSIGARGWR
jgi:hypothetical protein